MLQCEDDYTEVSKLTQTFSKLTWFINNIIQVACVCVHPLQMLLVTYGCFFCLLVSSVILLYIIVYFFFLLSFVSSCPRLSQLWKYSCGKQFLWLYITNKVQNLKRSEVNDKSIHIFFHTILIADGSSEVEIINNTVAKKLLYLKKVEVFKYNKILW